VPPSVNQSKFEEVMNRLTDKYGGAVRAVTPEKHKSAFHIRRPTGIMSVDSQLMGGWPGGSIIQVHGPDGIGKDALINLTMAENQRLYGDESFMFWCSFGYQADLDFMRLCGMQIAYSDQELQMMDIDPDEATPEQRGSTTGRIVFLELGDVEEAASAPAETIMEGVIELVNSGIFQVGLINELGSGETRDNVVKELHEDVKIATWSRLMSQFCTRWYTTIRRALPTGEPNLTTLGVINPVRANLNAYTAKFKPTIATSGHALEHAKAVDLHLKPTGVVKKGQNRIGKTVGWKIAKGKHGMPEGAEGEYDWIDGVGVDLVKDLCTVANEYGVVQQRGKNYTIQGYEDKIEGGLAGVIEFVRERPELQPVIREATYAALSGR
jgi:RecA/RadA recombinase